MADIPCYAAFNQETLLRKYHVHFDNFLPMAQLRLGTIGLSPKDVAYIRALVRLYANTDKLGWSFADQPPYEAVVVKRAGRDADPAWFETFDGMVLTLVGPPGAPERDEVAYPVHADQFRTWLKLRQHGMALPVASAPPVTVPAATQLAAPASAPAPVAEPEAVTAPAQPARQGQRRFKLRRWPAPALLAGNDFHLKIATLMVRNAIGTEMLAVLTGHPESDCRRFVDALHKQGLLIEHAALSTLVEPAATPAAPPARAGLLASLRRHLGV